MYLLQLGRHQMRRYVGEGGEGGSYTGHREAGVTQVVGQASVMTPVRTSTARRLAMEMLEGQHGSLVCSAVMGRYLPPDVRRVQLGVRVGRVSVAAPSRAEHHVTPGHRALVHLPQVHSGEVDLEGALVTEGLQTHVTLDPLLAGGRVNKGGAEVIKHKIELTRGLHRPPARAAVRLLLRPRLRLGVEAPAEGGREEVVLLVMRLPVLDLTSSPGVMEPRSCELVLIW